MNAEATVDGLKVGDRVVDLALAPAQRRAGVMQDVWACDGRTLVRVKWDERRPPFPDSTIREPSQLHLRPVRVVSKGGGA